MPWGPITPARIVWADDGAVPHAPNFGDVYHARAGAIAQAQQVFLAGNGLPQRWQHHFQQQPRFTILETGFGLGNNFLATWEAWDAWNTGHQPRIRHHAGLPAEVPADVQADVQADAQPAAHPPRLVFVSVEKHPPTRADLQRAHAVHAGTPIAALAARLQAAWPPATPDLHVLDFDGPPDHPDLPGHRRRPAVRLLLAFGDAQQVLPELLLQADAVFLDGFAPRVNAELWSERLLRHQLPRLCAPGATLATWCVAGPVRQALAQAGFAVHKAPGFGGKREMLRARYAPRHLPPTPPGRLAQPQARQVAIVGAGIAGAAAARALARQGLQVTVLERQGQPAQETSGNAGGLFHSVLMPDDGPHARWLRAAALHTQRVLQPLIQAGTVPGQVDGLLRGERQLTAEQMRQRLARQHQPPEHVQVLPGRAERGGGGGGDGGAGEDTSAGAAAGAAADAGMPHGDPAWCFTGGGWVSPPALARHWLAESGARLLTHATVARLQRQGDRWQLLDAQGQTLAEADAVLLCNAHDAPRLLAEAGIDPGWPLQRVRGQTTLLTPEVPGIASLPLQRPLADSGYALRLHDGRVLCGAVAQPGDEEPAVREADHRSHLRTLQRLTGWPAPADDAPLPPLQGRVGWRLVADDRLPVLGAVPAGAPQAGRQPACDADETADATDTAQRPTAVAAPARPPRPLTQVREVARAPGLWVFTALGSRGLTQAALAAEVLAARLTGAPVPLPVGVLDALDPARWAVRAARKPPAG